MVEVLEHRQPDLTVVLENVFDPHNVSAVLRTCDAVGITTVHLVYTVEERPELSRGVSGSAVRWLDLVDHDSISACYDMLRMQGFTIYATHLDEERIELFDLDLTTSTALVFGNERRGVSAEAVEGADASVMIPMVGMVQSLNVSVACAVTLYEALRQRRAAELYQQPRLTTSEIAARLHKWMRRERRSIP